MKLEKFDLEHRSCCWWLRSAFSYYSSGVGIIDYSGYESYYNANGDIAVLPACIII